MTLNTKWCQGQVSYVMFRPENGTPERQAGWRGGGRPGLLWTGPATATNKGKGRGGFTVLAARRVGELPATGIGATGDHEVLVPLGVTEDVLSAWLFSRAGYLAMPGLIESGNELSSAHLPLFASASAASLPMVQ